MRHQDDDDGPVSVWLVPDPASAARFQAVIDGLADREGTPRFVPHMTLLASDGPTGHGAGWFKALFVTFPGGALDALQAEVAARLGPTDYVFDPHLSLLYGDLSPERLAGLARLHSHEGDPVRFDRLVVVRPAPGADDFGDVAGWRLSPPLFLGS